MKILGVNPFGLKIVMALNLEDLLEHPARAGFYDLLGGLADNFMTIGSAAGSFLECNDCGSTFTTKDTDWVCACCGRVFELKFTPLPPQTASAPIDGFETKIRITTKTRVTGLRKPGINPHWFYNNENWSVAEFAHQIHRAQPERTLTPWLRHLGVPIADTSILESFLTWPRFQFGGKTIQPDVALAFSSHVVLFEFKRPVGGTTPGHEVMGQLAFAKNAARQLNRDWHVILVPGSDAATAQSPDKWVEIAVASLPTTLAKWPEHEAIIREVAAMPVVELGRRVSITTWPVAVHAFSSTVENLLPVSWTRDRILAQLSFFLKSRAEVFESAKGSSGGLKPIH